MAVVAAGPRTGTTNAPLMMADTQQKLEGRIPLVTHVITDDDMGLLQVRREKAQNPNHGIHVRRTGF